VGQRDHPTLHLAGLQPHVRLTGQLERDLLDVEVQPTRRGQGDELPQLGDAAPERRGDGGLPRHGEDVHRQGAEADSDYHDVTDRVDTRGRQRQRGVVADAIDHGGDAPAPGRGTDLLGGVLPVAVVSLPVALANAKSDKLRVIAVTSAARHPSAPDWPAVSDTLRGFEASPRLFLIAPQGTPAPVVARLNDALRQALEQPDLLEAFARQGATATWSSADALELEIQNEVRKWDAIARASGAKGS